MAPAQQMYSAVVRNTFIDVVEETQTKQSRRPRAFTSDGKFPHGKETCEPLFHIAYSGSEPESEPNDPRPDQIPGRRADEFDSSSNTTLASCLDAIKELQLDSLTSNTPEMQNQEPGQQLLMMLQQQEEGQQLEVPQQQLQQLQRQQLQQRQQQQQQQQQQQPDQQQTMLVDTSSGVPICYAVCLVAPGTVFTPAFDPCQSQLMDQQQQYNQQQQQQQEQDQIYHQQQEQQQWQQQPKQLLQQQQLWQSQFQQQEQQQEQEQWHSRAHGRQQQHQQPPWRSQQQQQQQQEQQPKQQPQQQQNQQPQRLQLRPWQAPQQQPLQNRRTEFQHNEQHQRNEQNLQHQRQQQQQFKEQMLNAVPEHLRTTVMLRNIPNGYSSEMLKEMLDMNGFEGEYDFLYLPMDFRSGVNIGYAFVNGIDPTVAARLRSGFEGFERWAIQSPKVCQVSWSHPQQGFAEHVERYRNSPVMHESVPIEYKPRIFQNGQEVSFPVPTQFIRPVKVRKSQALSLPDDVSSA